jgi:hypothetical protein
MKAFSFALALLGASLTFGQGSKGAIDFSANPGGKNHVDLGNLPIGTTDFTVEFWYKSNADASDPAIFSNKDWNSGSNTGINFNFQSTGNVFKINFKGATGARKDLTISGFTFTSGWNHIAVTVSRADSLKCYLNGIRKGAMLISASTGDLTSVNTYKLGQDGTGNYPAQVTGKLDEFRIWNAALSQTQIQDRMCTELVGNEADLLVYYSFNDLPGSTVQDLTSNYPGTLQNGTAASWTASGAPIGNQSTYLYTNVWTGTNLTLNGTSGSVVLDNISGTHKGIQFYKVNGAPINQNGISLLSATNDYFGVFYVEANGSSSVMHFDYSGNTDAQANESNIILFSRATNNTTPWLDASATITTSTNSLTDTIASSSEFILGFANAVCDDPTNYSASNITFGDAAINWTSAAASVSIEYGTSGFSIGSGTVITSSNASEILTNLTSNTSYDVYLTAQCAGGVLSNTVGPITFQTLSIPSNVSQGSGLAINNTSNTGFVDLSNGKVSAASLQLPTQNITVEAWVNPRTFQTWDGIVSFIQDNGSYERGWDLEVRDNGKFAFALTTSGVITYLETNSSFEANKWYHLTGTYDGTTQKIYVNGHLEGTGTANSGPIDYSDSWLAVGSYKDDNESNTLEGQIDEVRIWNITRTDAEIQASMCHKLTGTETGLTHYYRFDELGSTQPANLTGLTAPGSFSNLTIANKIPSGAPIGDTSSTIYDQASWSGIQLTLPTANGFQPIVSALNGHPYGIHLYQINGTPDGDLNTTVLNNLPVYYGVFVAENQLMAPAQFTFKWNYSANSAAVTAESDLRLISKNTRIDSWWALNEFTQNTTQHFELSDTAVLRKEFAFASDLSSACSLPEGITSADNGTSGATIFWNNGGSGISNFQWGEAGFTLGTGTTVSNITSDSLELSSLNADFTYEIYVQDSCVGGNSIWVGPYIYQPEVCELPTNAAILFVTDTTAQASWDQLNGNDWTISWGPAGLQPDWGITANSSQGSYTWEGLSPNTAYEFYVKANCTGNSSTWTGPIPFTTTDVAGIETYQNSFSLYPNPFKESFSVKGTHNIDALEIVNTAGQQVSFTTTTTNGLVVIDGIQEAGIYFLTITTEGNKQTYKLVKN